MTNLTTTEAIGKSINAWDDFYKAHFDWVYRQTLAACHNTLKAKQLTDRIFTKVLLSQPKVVAENDVQGLQNELGILFPYMGVRVNPDKELSAGRFLHLFYHPN